ncbi:hypothetical protein C8Q80DRAFT_1109193 [Daedaleopsis nitida]|nr:hypothetical protein C8Q80DRAFT_1109193 [Daedaleopsis nitida]
MSSMNAGHVFQVAHQDASRFPAGQVNLKDISEADARRLMSEEHKALGYRPPPGSLAAQAQAAIARHETHRAEEHTLTVDAAKLREAAIDDAQRIKEQRDSVAPASVDLESVGESEARKLMSDEHKALGYRPPPGSLAAEAQAAAAKHPDASSGVDTATLARAALEDASKISSGAENTSQQFNLKAVGEADARALMSEEHRALGYRPPPGSLAATAQAEAAKHPDAKGNVDAATLAQAALQDAQRIEAQRAAANAPANPAEQLNLDTISADEARTIQSEEHKILGHRPPAGSAAAQAQRAVDSRAQVPLSKEMAAELVSQEHKARGHLPESGTIAPVAQSLADQNDRDGGGRSLGDVGM